MLIARDMKRKPSGGDIRNKERSKKKFLDAVGTILETTGYTGLKINNIATVAGVDKKMIYNYFGSVDGLIDEYVRSLDFWSNVKGDALAMNDGGCEFVKQSLTHQYDYVSDHKNLQQVLLWGLAEQRESLTAIADERERNGELLLTHITDPHFKQDSSQFRAVAAILISGIYYLNMYKGVNAKTFCGIDLTTEGGTQEIKNALVKMIDLVYKDHNQPTSAE